MKRTYVVFLILALFTAVSCIALANRPKPQASAPTAADTASSPGNTSTTKQPPAVPASLAAPDATITNAPVLAGTTVINLPPLSAGEARSIIDGDGSFDINEDGDLIRGFTEIPSATTKSVTIRRAHTDGSFQESTRAIAITAAPWTLDAFPELIVQSLTQESVRQPGPVASVKLAGVIALAKGHSTATAASGFEPTKLADDQGIAFAAESGQHLSFPYESDALSLYRWSLVIFRCDAGNGSNRPLTLLCVNDGPQGNGRSGNWIPRLEYNPTDQSVVATYRGTARHQLASPAASVATDGRWNVALTFRRHGRLFLRVNGRDCGQPSPTESFSTERPEDIIESRIGDQTAKAPAWALDGMWIGQSELSERTVKKMEAWALIRASALPGGAAALPALQPLVDNEDFPHRYRFDYDRWAQWKTANPNEKRTEFQGQAVATVQPNRDGWVCVFRDDFRKPATVGKRSLNGTSVGDSTADVDAGKQIWYAPGTNSAVGGRAICKDGNDRPYKEVYVPDADAGTLTMRLYCAIPAKDGKPAQWRNSQFTSVNEAGLGYSWAGAKGFRVRAKLNNVGPEVFPCPIWFYSLNHLFWRTEERIEFDIIELDDNWDNYGASHVHRGNYPGLFGHSAYDTMKKAPPEIKSLKLAAGKQVCGIDAWDGNFHTWEVWIEDAMTYINVDGLEVARVDTTPEYLERFYMYIDTCLKNEKGMDESLSYDLVLDQVEAFAPQTVVDAIPSAPFTARPTITGTTSVGSVITCTANVDDCDDVWYYWHSDGYPRGFGSSKTYTVVADDLGAEIRCMVKAVGAKDQPESWTAPMAIH